MLSIAARRPHFRFCWRVVDDVLAMALPGSLERALSIV